ncbi:MAG TPA: DUF1223 domain-containing protein [Acidobacteriaceae bacterium]|jgi:hypothetical protein|nr:DUF1223 domain-containing protein [Acidobacteriaceae bacterium]
MYRTMAVLALATVGVAAGWGAAAGQRVAASESQPEPILVELFTSEGCSSCPPADALLGRMAGKTMPSGRPIITISEHVTYWNHDGWMDPFSSDAVTERQQEYVDHLHVDGGPYTPQMVIEGTAQVAGSDEVALDHALQQADQSKTGVALSIGPVDANKDSMEVHFQLSGDTGKAHKVQVTVFVTDDDDQVHVKAGENADRTLTHVSVARSMNHVDLHGGALSGTIRVRLPSKPPVGGDTGRHLIVVAQQDGQGQVLAVATRSM